MPRNFPSLAGGFDGYVHHGLIEDVSGALTQQSGHVLGLGTLFQGAEDKSTPSAETIDFRFQLLQ
ncbi:hypothetical protein ALQ88_200219 [Pseudomonas savastanoi]|nr:hypothetical protein ALQ88_200219 [Pseudomonas savastanoi]